TNRKRSKERREEKTEKVERKKREDRIYPRSVKPRNRKYPNKKNASQLN
ncbi:IS4 family transposase, partial [Vibrio sp. vnigr-6D03]